jgi:hypothetical protein
MESSRNALSRCRNAMMLDFRPSNGAIESFAYSYLKRVRFIPGNISGPARFGKDIVRNLGGNLAGLRTIIAEQRTRSVQEGYDGEDGLKAPDAAHVEQTEIIESEEL